jgi:hypothetical protein
MIEFGRELARVAGVEERGDRKAIVHAASPADGGWEFFRVGGALALFDRQRIRVAGELSSVGRLSVRGGEERLPDESEETRGGNQEF